MNLPPPLPGTFEESGDPARPGGFRVFSAAVLSFYTLLFLLDGGLSLLSDSLLLASGHSPLANLQAWMGLGCAVMGFLVFAWMSVSTLVPKRFFLPLSLFQFFASAALLPLLVTGFARLTQISWVIALLQVVVGVIVSTRMAGGTRWRWPLLQTAQLGRKAFTWRNLFLFHTACVVLLLPVLFYLGYCGALAVDHFSDQFVVLHGDRLSMRAKKFVRADGKTIHLVPMVHIGQSSFYEEISRDLPPGALTLVEGVTDHKGLAREHLTYERMATSLGLTAQVKAFAPQKSRSLSADVDISDFSPITLEFLALMSEFQSGSPNAARFQSMVKKAEQPGVEATLIDDILTRRNTHLMSVIEAQLPGADVLVVPWGAAHMPGIARELRRLGFQVSDTKEYPIIEYQTVLEKLSANLQSPE